MQGSSVRFFQDGNGLRFRSAAALHGHTLHSRESLAFLSGLLEQNHLLRRAVSLQRRLHRNAPASIDFSRLFWMPPLGAAAAWDLESNQVRDRLGLHALVSLTDHDNIDAPLALQVLGRHSDVPVSFEWTVPRHGTYFHVGVHNLPAERAAGLFRDAQAFTANPARVPLLDLLDAMAVHPGVLIVLNHPLWDEGQIGETAHLQALEALLAEIRPFVHAVELNGFRGWQENCAAAEVGRSVGLPVVSGGDRHGRQPAALLNLTDAACFSEFAAEVRAGRSHILVMPEYLENRRFRIADSLCEILRDDPDHALGYRRWSDRVFYTADDGVDRSLTQLWRAGRVPAIVARFVGFMNMLDRCLSRRRLRSALSLALASSAEVAL